MGLNRALGVGVPALALLAVTALVLAVMIRWSGGGRPLVEAGRRAVTQPAEGTTAPTYRPATRGSPSGEAPAVRPPKPNSGGRLAPSRRAAPPRQPLPERPLEGPSFDHMNKEIWALWFSQLTEFGCENLMGPTDVSIGHLHCSCALLDMDDAEYQALECWREFEIKQSTAAEAKAALDAWLGSE